MTTTIRQQTTTALSQAPSNTARIRQVAVVFATISTIIINALANIVPFNGQETGAISDRLPSLFVPAGYVFAIWGVIYIGIIAYAIYQARSDQANLPGQRSIGLWYLLSCVANSVWIFLWHWNYLGSSVAVIILLLVSLLGLYLQMQKLGWEVGKGSRSKGETWNVFIPFSIYLAWVCVATVANIGSWLWSIQWGGWGLSEVTWAVLLIAIASGLGSFFGWWRRNPAYAAVIVWALVGIALKQADVIPVAYAAWIAAALVLVVALLQQAKRLRAS